MKSEPENTVPCNEPLIHCIYRMLGPLAGGIMLDTIDFVTFGPIGICGGFIFAMTVGWWISSIYVFPIGGRITFALLAGIYSALPFTEIFPVATIISAIARFREQPREHGSSSANEKSF